MTAALEGYFVLAILIGLASIFFDPYDAAPT